MKQRWFLTTRIIVDYTVGSLLLLGSFRGLAHSIRDGWAGILAWAVEVFIGVAFIIDGNRVRRYLNQNQII